MTGCRAAPSRRVWFSHPVGASAAAASVVVQVRARVAFRPSRRRLHNGQRVVFRGRAGGMYRRGLLVEIQARRGHPWQTFATTHTRSRGRFRYAYRFTRTLGVQPYRLRAKIPRQRGYPYATGASRAVRLRVTG